MLWAATGVLAVGIAVPTVAYAADPTPKGSAAAPDRVRKGLDQEKLAAALAKELGLEQQKVADALAKVREQFKPEGGAKPARPGGADRAANLKERLAQAVTDGKLTQAEADAIVKAHEAGVLGRHR